MGIKIIFLGTSNAIPTKSRNHTAIFFEHGSERILIDCGEGTQRQIRIAGINLCKINRILLTHTHGDHTIGIPGLLKTLEISGYSKTLHLYGPKGTKNHIKLLEKIYGKFNIKHEIKEVNSGKIVNEREIIVESIPMSHGLPTNAYSISLKEKLRLNKDKIIKLNLPNSPILKDLQEGKDIIYNKKKIKSADVTYKQPGKKVSIILDTKMNKNTIKIAKLSDVLICESTYLSNEEKQAKEYKHLTAKQAAIIAKKAKVKKLILIHIGNRYENKTDEIEKEATSIFKNTKIAKDFEQIIL